MKYKYFLAVFTALLSAIAQAHFADTSFAAAPKGVCETFTKNPKILTHNGQHPVYNFDNFVQLSAEVIDGNRLTATGKKGNKFDVRLIGSSAPASGQKGGKEAADFLRKQLADAGGKVVMFHDGQQTDKNNGRLQLRLVCVINAKNELVCLDELLVRSGLAKAADGDYSSKNYFQQIKPDNRNAQPVQPAGKPAQPATGKTYKFTSVSGKEYEREFVRFGKDANGTERVYWKTSDGETKNIKFELLTQESQDWVKKQSGGTVKPSAPDSDKLIADLFAAKRSDVQVKGSGVVTKLLADDNEGDRHQRFILKLAGGQTLLIAHNIDIAPRIDGLAVGDTVEFYGEYYYNEKGGGIHWTHRDRQGKHTDGYLKRNGKIYQ